MKSPGISNSGKWPHPRPDEESGGGKTCRPEKSPEAHAGPEGNVALRVPLFPPARFLSWADPSCEPESRGAQVT